MNVEDLRTKVDDILQYLKIDNSSINVEETVPVVLRRRKEIFLVLDSLKEFLNNSDLDKALHILPDTGQLLGRLCSLNVVICDSELFKAVLTCMLCLYKQNPSTQLEKKAKQWVLAQIKNSTYLTKKQEFVVFRLGLGRSDVIDEQLRLLLKHVSTALEKIHSNIKAKYKAQGCLPRSLLVDSSLKSIVMTVLSIPYFDTLSLVWEKLLDVLSNYSNSDPSVNMVYQRLMEIQKQSFISKDYSESAPALSRRCCYLLWTSYLPSLEQAVLQVVQEAKKFTLPSNIKNCLNRHHLVSICAEHSHLHMAVIQMIHTLMVGSGSPFVADIMSLLNFQIQNLISHHQLHTDPLDSFCTRYPANIQSLVSQLLLNHRDLTMDQAGYHITHITECIKTLHNHYGNQLSLLFLLHFKHWHIKAVQICLICDKKHVSGCLELTSYMCNYTHTEREEYYGRLQSLIMCLRPLLFKSSLNLNDIKYALAASQSDCKDGEMDAAIGQILVSFIFYSSGGVKLTAEILEMVTGKVDPFENLTTLMMAHEYFDIEFSQWSVNKLQDYSTIIENLVFSVTEQKTDSTIQIKEISDATSEFLISAKQLIRQEN